MADKPLVKDLQKLDPGSELVHLYELEFEKGSFVYFASHGLDDDLSVLQMRDYDNPGTIRSYAALPVKAEGFETKNDGAMARPNVLLANVNTVFSNAVGTLDYNDFLGLKLIRRTTLKKYLYGESGDANPPVEFPRQVWVMDRIKARNKAHVQIELVSPFDIENVVIPARKVYADRCSHKYQGASSHLDRWKKAQSGCTWAVDGAIYNNAGTKYTIHVNQDDEYIVPSSVSFASYSSGAVNLDAYYKTTKTTTRFNANGTTSSVTISNYWQATKTISNPGTPTDSNINFKRVRIYSTYNHGTEYFTYIDDRDNDYVVFTDNVSSSETYNKALLWKASQPSKSQVPAYSKYWEKGDLCSKTTTGCKMRFGVVATSGGTGKTSTTREALLPFGGFPAARSFK